MRVTMLVRCLAMMRGGGETRHLAWMRELQHLGVDVDVITGQPLVFGGPRHAVIDLPATVVRSPYARDAVYRWQWRRGFGRLTSAALHLDEEWFCRAAWRRIAARSSRPDIVHAHALHQAARVCRGHVPVVINLPGVPHSRYRQDLSRADALVADGWAADHLPALLGRPIERVPKGVDTELFQPHGPSRRIALGLAANHVVLAVGRLVPIKNVALLISAMKAVRAEHASAHLLLVGEGPALPRLRRQVAELDLADGVTFAGYVPQTELPSFYRAADLFALTSDFDNSPNAMLEAMASGLPIVSTDVGGVRHVLEADRGGALVPPRDPDALAAALGRWLRPADRRAEAGRFNRQLVLERFTWRASAARLLDVYRKILVTRATL